MEFRRKIICILILSLMFLTFLIINFVSDNQDEVKIIEVNTPLEFITDKNVKYVLKSDETFSPDYTDANRVIAKNLAITEDEAFITLLTQLSL